MAGTLNASTLNIVNTASSANTNGLTPPSFMVVAVGPGANTVSVDIRGTYSAVWSTALCINGVDLTTVPMANWFNVADNTTGIASGATGTFRTEVVGPGFLYLYFSAYTSGSAVSVIASAPGTSDSSGGGGGGGSVTVTNFGTQGTGLNPPSGGSGVIGFLSGIYSRLAAVVLGAGSAIIGKVGIDQTTPGVTNGVQQVAATTWDNSGAAITAAVDIVGTAGKLSHLSLDNTSATTTYWCQIFNIAAASVVLGTTAPIWQGQVTFGPGGREVIFSNPLANGGTALSIAYTTLPKGSVAASAATCYATVAYL